MTHLKGIALLIVLVGCWGCAGRKTTFMDSATPEASKKKATPSGDAVETETSELGQRADSLWALRGDPEKAKEAIAAYQKASREIPGDHHLLARLSRAYYLVANYVEKDQSKKDSLFTLGLETAEKALMLHSGFKKVFEEEKDEKKAVKEVDKDFIEACYWLSANLGKWASTKNLLIRLGNKSKLEAYSQQVMDLDENFFYGAAHRFFGALPTKVPGGDLNLAQKHFEKALEIAPNYFGTRTLYAAFWATKAQNKEIFMKQLEYVLNTPHDVVPEIAPENKYEQEFARELMEKAGDWFD